MNLKPYNNPTLRDVVYHIDEPEKGCEGEVVEVETGEFAKYFRVEWYDGEIEKYFLDDHPDILVQGA